MFENLFKSKSINKGFIYMFKNKEIWKNSQAFYFLVNVIVKADFSIYKSNL